MRTFIRPRATFACALARKCSTRCGARWPRRCRRTRRDAFATNAGGVFAGISAVPIQSTQVSGTCNRCSKTSPAIADAVPGTIVCACSHSLHRTYIFASDGDALLLVDQHAAHERIAYESIVAASAQGAPSEPLLVPLVVELDAERSAALERSLDALREGGLEIEAVRRAELSHRRDAGRLRRAAVRRCRFPRRSERRPEAARGARAGLGVAGVSFGYVAGERLEPRR